jgi:transposase-like protein
MGERALAQILAGVTTRRYEGSLEAMPEQFEVTSTSKSSVSRRFIAATKQKAKAFIGRNLDDDYRVIMLDGLHAGDHVIITAMGITGDGRKHILGCTEGSTENSAACRRLLSNLVERGLKVEVGRVFVIDGAKALRSAVKSIFGGFAHIQRCQVHKEANVLEHLPEEKRTWTKTRFRAAVRNRDIAKGKRALRKLATDLEEKHPSAANSICEGFDELFTVGGFGADGWLFDTLRSTNPLENANGTVRKVGRNVKRWRSGSMVLRWAVTGFIEAEAHFRRIKGFRHLPAFIAQIDKRHSPATEEVA